MKNKRGFYDVFVRTCGKYPSNIAVRQFVGPGEYICLSYSELYGACEYIAQQFQMIRCNKGIIGIVSTTNYMIPCVIAAAHKCCTSFMFLDPHQNNEEIIDEVRFTAILSILPKSQNINEAILRIPDKVVTILGMTLSFYSYGPQPDLKRSLDYSYIAMTSGSTGYPKKIQVPVHCIQPNIDDLTSIFNVVPEDIIYFSTPLTFDPAMVELLLACVNGASLLIAPKNVNVLFPSDLTNSVTIWQTTPSLFLHLPNDAIRHVLSPESTLRILALGGEPLLGVKRIRQLKDPENKTKLFTLYGVTEMSCWACVAELNLDKTLSDQDVPLGRCLSETKVILQSEAEAKSSGNIVLVSKTRNCVILNRKTAGQEINSLKFIDTGDIGEISKSGTIYYRGRRDDVIKRFGVKINLQAIESVVLSCPRVKNCSCVWLPKPKLLVVYFTSESIVSQDLTDYLKCKLDDRQWPDKIIRVDSLPLNAHGKVAKSLLPKMSKESTSAVSTVSIIKLKCELLQELKHVLKLNHAKFDDIKNQDFFSLGGTSFGAVTLSNRLGSSHPEFGKFILPHLLNPTKTMEQIINSTYKNIYYLDPSPKKKMKKNTSGTTSPTRATTSSAEVRKKKYTTNLIEMWSQDTGKCVDATPTLLQLEVNLYVMVGSHSGQVIVVDAMTGYLVGSIDMHSRVEAAVLWCHQNKEPTLAIAGSYDGTIVCFSVEYCSEIWRVNIGCMIKSKPVYWEGLVYIAGYDGQIYGLDLRTGQTVLIIQITDQGICADLVIAKNEYILTGALSGECASIHTLTNSIAWRCSLDSPVFAAPKLYDNDKYVVFIEVTGHIHCRTVEKGIKVWKYSGAKGNIFSSIHIKDIDKTTFQMVFGCHDNMVYSIKVKNSQPSLHWKVDLLAPIYSTPCGLYENLIIAASNEGVITIMSAEDGSMVGQHMLPAKTFSSPAVYGDYVFIGCRNDLLYGFRFVEN